MAGMHPSPALTHAPIHAAAAPAPKPGLRAQRVLAAALAHALVGRAALVRGGGATPSVVLRLSTAHIEQLLARLAAIEPPVGAPPVVLPVVSAES
jgi:hypothetical protein